MTCCGPALGSSGRTLKFKPPRIPKSVALHERQPHHRRRRLHWTQRRPTDRRTGHRDRDRRHLARPIDRSCGYPFRVEPWTVSRHAFPWVKRTWFIQASEPSSTGIVHQTSGSRSRLFPRCELIRKSGRNPLIQKTAGFYHTRAGPLFSAGKPDPSPSSTSPLRNDPFLGYANTCWRAGFLRPFGITFPSAGFGVFLNFPGN